MNIRENGKTIHVQSMSFIYMQYVGIRSIIDKHEIITKEATLKIKHGGTRLGSIGIGHLPGASKTVWKAFADKVWKPL